MIQRARAIRGNSAFVRLFHSYADKDDSKVIG